MYGRGNYVPQFGQGLQRPMPPYQQLPGGHPPPLQFQPGQPFPMQPGTQQGGPPRLAPPPGPGYPHVPPPPLNMPPQGPQNANQSFLQRPLIHGGPPPRHPYPTGQHNFTSSGPPPSLVPPRGLPPPPLQHPAGYGAVGVHNISFRPPPPLSQPPSVFFPSPSATQQQSAGSHMPLPSQPPPPPPPSVPIVPEPSFIPAPVTAGSPVAHGAVPGQNQVLEPESTAEVETGSGEEGTSIPHTDLLSKTSAPPELPPPPPKPTDEAIVRNIEVLCQFIAKNGSQFEEMARKNESENPKFSFLVGGDPGTEASCAREYYLWMKKKCGLLHDSDNGEEQKNLSLVHTDGMTSTVLNVCANMATVHSPADSDVDMEDDITVDKEPEVYTLGEELKSEPVIDREVLDMQEQETMLVYARDNTSAINSNLPVKSEEETETKSENSSGQLGRIDSPFRLIQNYASDDNSEDELLQDQREAKTVPTPLSPGLSTLCDVKNGTTSEPGLAQSVTAFVETVDGLLVKEETLAAQSESEGTSTKVFSRNNETDDRYDGDEQSNLNADFQGRNASEGGGVNTVISKDIERNDKKSTSTAPKMDEFGRIAKGGASDSEPDDTPRVRRRGRRERSRSRSRSPSDRRRRRSPYRGKGRRSRSRSRSPKRRRSRSRSPHRSRGDFSGENLRRGRAQAQECFDFLKGRCYRGASCRYLHHDVGKSESSRRYKGKHGDDDGWTSKPNDETHKAESIIDVVPNVLHEDVDNSVVDFKDSKDHRADAAHVKGASGENMPCLPIGEEHRTFGMASTSQTIPHSSEAPQEDNDLQAMVVTGKTEVSAVETSMVSPTRISTESYQGLTSNAPTGPSASPDIPNQISHPPLPPLASEGTNDPEQSKELVEYNSINPSATFTHHTVPLHAPPPPYQARLPSQQSHYPPNSAWSILPPSHPRPPHPVDLSNTSGPLQFQQGTSFVRDDRLSQFPSHGHGSTGFFAPGVPSQPGLFPGHSHAMQSFPGNTMLAGDSSKQALHNHQLSQPPTFGPSQTSADSMPSNLGRSQSVSRHASDSLVREHPSHFVDVGQSKISAHYNPYASTFDQPLSSRFSSGFAQERVSASRVNYDSSFSLSHGPMEGQSAGGYGSGAEGRMPRSGGDQYDPLFDSMEPSSKRAQKQDHAVNNSDMLTVSSHQRLFDVADNKQKAVGAVVATTSLDNDEYGETADAEVGVVENGSLSETDDDDIVAEGEIEIDQINLGGDNKKSKDSRSMKLFKVAVASFVKEVLKPQWRQGNMSKEVFKTIVKKTVDKVSGAMKNHRVPKSQAKIDHYIDSSRRKLTQLVEGYVSKYKS